jgi:hypothetical protein
MKITKETGGEVLKSTPSYHEKVALIKRHIGNQAHGVYRLIRVFKKRFYKENINFLKKYNDDENL